MLFQAGTPTKGTWYSVEAVLVTARGKNWFMCVSTLPAYIQKQRRSVVSAFRRHIYPLLSSKQSRLIISMASGISSATCLSLVFSGSLSSTTNRSTESTRHCWVTCLVGARGATPMTVTHCTNVQCAGQSQ